MDAPTFLSGLRSRIAEHRALSHPLLRHLATDGSQGDFVVFGQQHIHLVGRFTRYLEELLIRAPGSEDKLWIAKVLVDEYGEGSDGRDHATLYREWLQKLAAPGPVDVEACPAVQQFIGGHLRLLGERPFLFGLGMVGPGHEWAIPTMFGPIIQGLRRIGQQDQDMLYFPLHCEQDEEHGAWLEEALRRHAAGETAQELVMAGAEESLRLRAALWDGIYAKMQVVREGREKDPVLT